MKSSVAFLAAAAAARAAVPNPAPDGAAPAAKPYTLFMGADFSLHSGEGYFRVLNVVGSSFVIRKDGRFVHVHPGTLPIAIEVKRSLKLMPGSADLESFSWERDYMEGTNPEEKAAVAFTNLAGYQEGQLDDQIKVQTQGVYGALPPTNGLMSGVVAPSGAPVPVSAGGGPMNPMQSAAATVVAQREQLDQTQASEINDASETLRDDTFTTNAYNHSQRDAAAADGRNAIHIKFNLRSPLALRRPYAMFIALIHAPGHEHQKQQWIGGTEIDSVEPGRPVHVDFFQGGFPPGYQVDKLSVYIYDDGGREVGTNQSNDRVALTRIQAFQYLVIEYLGDHKNSSLPATPAMTKLPADWRGHAGEAWFRQTYYVKVDRTGHARGIFADPDCREPASPYLAEAIAGVWFRPALKQGKPVDTVAQVVPQSLLE